MVSAAQCRHAPRRRCQRHQDQAPFAERGDRRCPTGYDGEQHWRKRVFDHTNVSDIGVTGAVVYDLVGGLQTIGTECPP